jgi:hypothetical protein
MKFLLNAQNKNQYKIIFDMRFFEIEIKKRVPTRLTKYFKAHVKK